MKDDIRKIQGRETSFSSVKAEIESKIIRGDYEAGDRIPSMRELSNQYDIGLTTAQKVLNSLDDDGIISKKRGVGFFVKPFITQRLIRKHTEICKNLFYTAIEYAQNMNLDSRQIVDEILNEKSAE